MVWSADRRFERFEVLTVLFDDLESKLSRSMVWSADGEMEGFRMQTVEFHSLECKPSKEHLFTVQGAHQSNVKMQRSVREKI